MLTIPSYYFNKNKNDSILNVKIMAIMHKSINVEINRQYTNI